MAITGTNTENQRMKFVAEEIEATTSLTVNGQPVGGSAPDASEVTFTSNEGLTATDVAAALDELKALIDGLSA